jgi:hypothetical protein
MLKNGWDLETYVVDLLVAATASLEGESPRCPRQPGVAGF